MDKFKNNAPTIEGIDLEKLQAIARKGLPLILSIFVICNLAAYLFLRYTKDVFESYSEIKLDVRRDATELGIKTITEDPNVNIVAGEIEQIKSKVFLGRLADSLKQQIGYFSKGNVLKNELYKVSPICVIPVVLKSSEEDDVPIYFSSADGHSFKLSKENNQKEINGTFDTPVQIGNSTIIIKKNSNYASMDLSSLFFVIRSKTSLVNLLSKNLMVDPLNYSANTIRVSFKDYNALKAFDIVNKIDSLYIIYSNEQKNLANKQKIEWLNHELAQVEKRMEDFENYFENFTLQNKSSDVTLDLRRIITAINHIDSQRYILNKRIVELNTIVDAFSNGVNSKNFYPRGILPEYLNEQLGNLQLLINQRDKLALAYNENTFAYKQKEKDVTEAKDRAFSILNNLKHEWMNTLTELRDQKGKLESEFNTMPDKNTKFLKNQRFYNLFTEFYLTMMQSKSEFEIAQAGSVPDFKILSSATMPGEPVSPKRLLIYGIGFSLGLISALFALGVMYVINNKITSLKEVEDTLDVPILGVIPSSRQPRISPFHVLDNPQSMLSESIRSLRTNLDFFHSASGKKVITVTSTISGEGKSFVALNLGAVLAISRKKAIIVDLDMRKPKKILPSTIEQTEKGLSTILIRKNSIQDCIQQTEIEFLDFIPSGPQPPNPSELLLNGEFSSLIEELKQQYDFVLLDTPPIGLVTDAVFAMRKSDLSIYVIRANYSRSEFLRNVERVMTMNKLSNMALVVNSLNQAGKNYGYGYYYEKPVKRTWNDILKS